MILDKEKIQAVIFDMDGVLFLSGDSHERAWRETLESIGITDFSYATIAGMRTDDALIKVIREHGICRAWRATRCSDSLLVVSKSGMNA